MAQKQLEKLNFKLKTTEQYTQTGDIYEFIICLSKTKRARIYFSESYIIRNKVSNDSLV